MKKKRRVSNSDLRKYFLIGIVAILIFLSYKIIAPYIITLITAFVLAYLVKPLYDKLNKKTGKTLAAIISVTLIVIAILLIAGLVTNEILGQAESFVQHNNLEIFLDKISESPIIAKFNIDLAEVSKRSTLFLASLLQDALTYLPEIVITFLILILGIYYILINWENLSTRLKNYLPFKNKEKIAKEISDMTRALVYGSILIALIQFVIGIIGFYLAGVELYMLLSLILFFLAFFPGIGPAIVWVPTAIYYLATRSWITFIGVVITGLILSYLIDTIFRAKYLGKKTGISPFIMLIGIIGGVTVFGIFGFIIGPLILFYTIRLAKGIIENR